MDSVEQLIDLIAYDSSWDYVSELANVPKKVDTSTLELLDSVTQEPVLFELQPKLPLFCTSNNNCAKQCTELVYENTRLSVGSKLEQNSVDAPVHRYKKGSQLDNSPLNIPKGSSGVVSKFDYQVLESISASNEHSAHPRDLVYTKIFDFNTLASKSTAVAEYNEPNQNFGSSSQIASVTGTHPEGRMFYSNDFCPVDQADVNQTYSKEPMLYSNDYRPVEPADINGSDSGEQMFNTKIFDFNTLASKSTAVAEYNEPNQDFGSSSQIASVTGTHPEGRMFYSNDFCPVDPADVNQTYSEESMFYSNDFRPVNTSDVKEKMKGALDDAAYLSETDQEHVRPIIDDYLSMVKNGEANGNKKRKPKQKKEDKIRLAMEKKRSKYEVKQECKCKKKCPEIIPFDRRVKINKYFWELDYIAQKLYIRAQSTVSTPKTTKHPSAARDNVKYFLRTGIGANVEVCQQFFLTTLGFKPNNNTFVQSALNNEFPKPDGRGKNLNKWKFDQSIVIDHIMSFHPETSHYRREHAPLRKYLPSDVTITKMHKLFLEDHPTKPCSYDYYRKEVDKLNISFTKLGHEKCEQCEKFHKHVHILLTATSSCQECIDYEDHKKFYHEARIHYDRDKLIRDDPRNVIVSGDLMKVVMLPRMEMFKEVLFTRRICVFNETFAPIGGSLKLPVFAALWPEGIAGRKKEDLISCYHSFLMYYRNAETVTIWCDNCTAQNKCWALFCFMVYIVNSNEIAAKSITMKFLEKGHTFMSADSFHHQVELAMKQYEKGCVCDFDDFVKCVQSCNSQRVVCKELGISDFADWPDWTSMTKINNAVPRPYINKISKIKFVRGTKTMLYANGFEEDWIELDFIMTKHQGLNPPEMKTAPRGISREVKEGITTKLLPLMPFNRRIFWYGIPTKD